MIPNAWLKERMETTDFGEVFKDHLTRLGLSESDLHPAPKAREAWRVFIGQMTGGDELWFFESPPETWGGLAGRSGYAIVRSGSIVDSMVTAKS
jgi:hypothetical protein